MSRSRPTFTRVPPARAPGPRPNLASAHPSPADAVRQAGTSPLRIAFLPFYVPYYEAAHPGLAKEKLRYCRRLAEMLARHGKVLWDGKLICAEKQAAAAAARLSPAQIDCVVTFTSVAVFSAIPWAALRSYSGPLLLWNAQELARVDRDSDLATLIRHTCQVGTQALANTLLRADRAFRAITTGEGSEQANLALARFFRTVRVIRAVRGARLLAIGEAFPAMLDVLIDEAELKRHLDIDVIRVSPAAWTEHCRRITPEQIAARVRSITSANPPSGIGADEIRRSVRLAEALDTVVRKHAAAGGSLNCHGEACMRNPILGVSACYGLGIQNAAGRPFTCTGDLPTALAMIMLKQLAGVAMYTEVHMMDESRDAVVIANSGEGEPGILRSGEPCRLRGNANFRGLAGRGLAWAHPLQAGPATLVSFTPSPAGPKPYRLIAAEGQILEETLSAIGTLAGWFRFSQRRVADGCTRWLEAGPVHHAAAAPGHWAEDLHNLSSWLGFEFVRI